MIIITIRKNILRIIFISFVIIFTGLCFYKYNISKLEKTQVSVFLVSSTTYEDIEIFDVDKGKVIKVIQVNETTLNEAKSYIQRITGMYQKINALPNKGYIIKIPFEPYLVVKNQYLNDYNIDSIDKLFIIFPEGSSPYLLVLDDRERPYAYNFNGDTSVLLKSLNYGIGNLQ
jgi:uncharacterized ubiquitin-like protein YukD